MKHTVAPVKNIVALGAAIQSLVERDQSQPGIGLVHGFAGAGKTTAMTLMTNRHDAVFVRANAVWTPNAMLGAIVHELGGHPSGSNARQLAFVTERLIAAPRPIFLDEADYVVGNPKMLETLRDIHDTTRVPLLLVGMDEIARRITLRPQFSRRITQWVKFKAIDLADTRTVIDSICEVAIADDLAAQLHHAAGGSIGLITVGLARIEQQAKAQGWDSVDTKAWGRKPFFLARAPKA